MPDGLRMPSGVSAADRSPVPSQVAVLSRQLEGTRAEAAHETRLAAERLSQLRARAAELEKLIDRQEAENRLLRQASAETDQLTQVLERDRPAHSGTGE